jgi:5-methylcytosine-specific restriction protein A
MTKTNRKRSRSFPRAVARLSVPKSREKNSPGKKPPKKGNEAAMPAKRRWFNPENERRGQFPGGWAKYRQQRPELAALYSGEAWRARRAEHLAANPTCVVCGRKATNVDHITNLASGGEFDGPLQSLCVPHHREKTQRESHEGMKRAAARRKSP